MQSEYLKCNDIYRFIGLTKENQDDESQVKVSQKWRVVVSDQSLVFWLTWQLLCTLSTTLRLDRRDSLQLTIYSSKVYFPG